MAHIIELRSKRGRPASSSRTFLHAVGSHVLAIFALYALALAVGAVALREKPADDSAHLASTAASEPIAVEVSAVETDDEFCPNGIPMTTVGFLSAPLAGALFHLVSSNGLDVEFDPGSFPLANGAYLWYAAPRDGFTLTGNASGTLALWKTCNGKSESALASVGSGDPYATTTAAVTGSSTVLFMPLSTSTATEVVENTPHQPSPKMGERENGQVFPRPILKLFVDNDPASASIALGDTVELRVTDIAAKSVKYLYRKKGEALQVLASGKYDDLLSDDGLTTWTYFWDTAKTDPSEYKFVARIAREDGSVVETVPVTLGVMETPKPGVAIDALPEKLNEFFADENGTPIDAPSACTDVSSCAGYCGESRERKAECVEFARVPLATTTNALGYLAERIGVRLHIDSDGDEIPDFDEVNLYGTDPTRVDSDRDGFLDGDEVIAGSISHTAQSGSMEVASEPVFVIDTERFPKQVAVVPEIVFEKVARTATTTGKTRGFSIIGRAYPNTFVTLYVFSRPFSVTVRTDDEGRFAYTLPADIADGAHRLFATVRDAAGVPFVRSEEYAFVKRGDRIGRTHIDPVAVSRDVPAPGGYMNDPLFTFFAALVVLSGTIAVIIGLHMKNRRRERFDLDHILRLNKTPQA